MTWPEAFSEEEKDEAARMVLALLQRIWEQVDAHEGRPHDRISSYCPDELKYDYKGRTA